MSLKYVYQFEIENINLLDNVVSILKEYNLDLLIEKNNQNKICKFVTSYRINCQNCFFGIKCGYGLVNVQTIECGLLIAKKHEFCLNGTRERLHNCPFKEKIINKITKKDKIINILNNIDGSLSNSELADEIIKKCFNE